MQPKQERCRSESIHARNSSRPFNSLKKTIEQVLVSRTIGKVNRARELSRFRVNQDFIAKRWGGEC
jgi:hypothetical protein